jgi:putative ABC transport system permease protein
VGRRAGTDTARVLGAFVPAISRAAVPAGPVERDAEQIVFAGEQKDLVRWLSVADVFLLPSAQESFGLAALDALACELPVIASNAGGLPEIIHNGINGYVCGLDALDEMASHALAYGMLRAMIATNAAAFPRLGEARIDAAAFTVAVMVALLAGTLGGAAPALAARRHVDTGTRSVARGFAGTRWRRALIATELALAMLVLAIAGFLARSVIHLNSVETGLAERGATTFSVALPESTYPDPMSVTRFRDDVIEQLERIGGVTSVAAASARPVGEATPGVVAPAGLASPPDYRPAAVYTVTPGYARTLGVALIGGRFFEPQDAVSTPVAVVNETLARTMWPKGDAFGRSLTLLGHAQPMLIVGVTGDVRQSGPLRPAAPAIYQLLAQSSQPVRTQHFIIGAAAPVVAEQVRRAVASVDAELPVFGMRTIGDSIAATMAVPRFNMLIVGVFAMVAAVLALSGLYAVLAQSVERGHRDFGIRLAVGATRGRVAAMVLMQAMLPSMIGIVSGALAAMAASELITSLLHGVQPNDPLTIVSIAALLLVASMAAVLAPALRAARVDPAVLLRAGGQ